MGKVVTYMALFGDYDPLYEPYFRSPGTELVCFTDIEGLRSRQWDVRMVKRKFDDPTRAARMLKILSHRIFPDAEMTIWVDSNLELLRALGNEARHVLDGKKMALYHHDKRECAYEEMKMCHELGKDDGRVMTHQMARYKKEGFPAGFGLAQTSFLIRANKPEVSLFNEAWWSEVERGSRRDQLSFDYCRWKLNMKVKWIDGSIWDGKFFLQRAHKI